MWEHSESCLTAYFVKFNLIVFIKDMELNCEVIQSKPNIHTFLHSPWQFTIMLLRCHSR